MKPEIKERWLAALRSGEYKQGKSYLKTSKGHCCLGVLCEVYKQETGIGDWVEKQGEQYFVPDSHIETGSSEYLPQTVVEWAETGTDSPATEQATLAELNDAGKSFTEIADLIEKHL